MYFFNNIDTNLILYIIIIFLFLYKNYIQKLKKNNKKLRGNCNKNTEEVDKKFNFNYNKNSEKIDKKINFKYSKNIKKNSNQKIDEILYNYIKLKKCILINEILKKKKF